MKQIKTAATLMIKKSINRREENELRAKKVSLHAIKTSLLACAILKRKAGIKALRIYGEKTERYI